MARATDSGNCATLLAHKQTDPKVSVNGYVYAKDYSADENNGGSLSIIDVCPAGTGVEYKKVIISELNSYIVTGFNISTNFNVLYVTASPKSASPADSFPYEMFIFRIGTTSGGQFTFTRVQKLGDDKIKKMSFYEKNFAISSDRNEKYLSDVPFVAKRIRDDASGRNFWKAAFLPGTSHSEVDMKMTRSFGDFEYDPIEFHSDAEISPLMMFADESTSYTIDRMVLEFTPVAMQSVPPWSYVLKVDSEVWVPIYIVTGEPYQLTFSYDGALALPPLPRVRARRTHRPPHPRCPHLRHHPRHYLQLHIHRLRISRHHLVRRRVTRVIVYRWGD